MSNSKESPDVIKITNFINPHQFYFKFDDGPSEFDLVGQSRLNSYCRNTWHANNEYVPKKNDRVCIFIPLWDKWIRAEIDEILHYNFSSKETEYVLWSIDEGISLLSTAQWMMPLPAEFIELYPLNVFVGSIAPYVPAKKVFDYKTMSNRMQVAKNWPLSAVRTFKELLSNAMTIFFQQTHKSTVKQQYFGRLQFIFNDGKQINIGEEFVNNEEAIVSGNFFNDLKCLRTVNKIRWKDNDGATDLFDSVNFQCKLMENFSKYKYVEMETREKIDDWHKRNENFAANNENTENIDDISIPEYCSVPVPEIDEDARSTFSTHNSRCDDTTTAFFDEYQNVSVKAIVKNTGITLDRSTFIPGGAEGDHIYRNRKF